MSTQIITSLDQAHSITDAWRRLAGSHPFRSPEWCLTWWQHIGAKLGRDVQLCLIANRTETGEITGLAPFYWHPSAIHGRLCFLASGQACSDYAAIWTNGEDSDSGPAIALAIEHFLRPKSRVASCRVELDGIEADASWYSEFQVCMQRLGYTTREKEIDSAYRVDLPGDWGDYQRSLGKSFVRKAKRIFKRFESGQLRFERTGDDLRQFDQRFEDLIRLHQLRRQTMGQPGIFADETFTQFLRVASRQLAARGQAEIQYCLHDESLIAIHLVFLHEQTVSMYASGIDPEIIDLEPGFSLIEGSIIDAIDRGFTCYDFLRGNEHYKQLWRATPTRLTRAFFTPNAIVPQFYDSAYAFAGNVKQLIGQAWSRS
jgi:CelD/BcsL family acetyltransferase involved in cellulose biosynthesis